jgi:hypothetical protein
MTSPPTHARHAALHNQPVRWWPGGRRWLERLEGAARPRFLSSVLVLGMVGLLLVGTGAALNTWLWAALAPWPGT